MSRDICTRNICRFFSIKSVMFSFSLCRSCLYILSATAPTPPNLFLRLLSTSLTASSSSSFSTFLEVLPARDDHVVFSCTGRVRKRFLSSSLRFRSSSRSEKISSSLGILKGFEGLESAPPRRSPPMLVSPSIAAVDDFLSLADISPPLGPCFPLCAHTSLLRPRPTTVPPLGALQPMQAPRDGQNGCLDQKRLLAFPGQNMK